MPKPIPAEVNKAIAPLIGTSSISSKRVAEDGDVGELGCAITIEVIARSTNVIDNSFKNLLTGCIK
jgi:hypothetical protein